MGAVFAMHSMVSSMVVFFSGFDKAIQQSQLFSADASVLIIGVNLLLKSNECPV